MSFTDLKLPLPRWMGEMQQMCCWHLLAETDEIGTFQLLFLSSDALETFLNPGFLTLLGCTAVYTSSLWKKREGFALLFVLPFAFKEHVSFLDCCAERHWVSAQFWPILKPPSACLFMCVYNILVLQFIEPGLVRCDSNLQGNSLLQIIPRSNLYMTARNLSKCVPMCLWRDADSSTITCQLTWTCLVPTKYPATLAGFFTFAWFWDICGISNFPIALLSLFSRAQRAKNTNLNCRKSCPFRLWPWFLSVSESWQIKSRNFLSKFPEVCEKLAGVTGLEDVMVPPRGWQLLLLRNWAGGPWAPLFSKYNTQKCAAVSFSTTALSASPICSLSLGNVGVVRCRGPELPKEAASRGKGSAVYHLGYF